ncbi:MAG: hypothetical protein FWG73_06795 [Planctomycetaceae bacterium]|nr:hypothetical protein [Planctomycetaceae bacterium]
MLCRLCFVPILLSAAVSVCLGQNATFVEPRTPHPALFDDWEQPKLLLFFTGFLDGYIEPCGCAGPDQMKGGLSRRHSCLQQLQQKGWDILPIDAGNLNKGFGLQEELKFNFVIDEAYRLMQYQAAGIGNRELLFPTDTLFLYTVDVPGNPKRYTSANVSLLEFSPEIVAPYRILEKAGLKIGIMSVLGDSLLRNISNDEIVSANAVAKIQEVLPKLESERCDRKVLIIHASAHETTQLLNQFAGQFDFILPSNTPAEPPLQPRTVGNAMLIEVGEKGRYAIAVGLFDDAERPIRYERVPLDARFENSPAILELMKMYQDQLRESGLSGLGIRPIPNARLQTQGNYAGAQSCADCHETAHRVWRSTGHSRAWQSLRETAIPPRNYDPECIACHVVGWNATELLPYQGGFLSERETPRLVSVGCEACHGPGELHIRAESGSDRELQARLRSALRLPLEGQAARRHCITCHDGDNSPLFDFDAYWEKIKHPEEPLFD